MWHCHKHYSVGFNRRHRLNCDYPPYSAVSMYILNCDYIVRSVSILLINEYSYCASPISFSHYRLTVRLSVAGIMRWLYLCCRKYQNAAAFVFDCAVVMCCVYLPIRKSFSRLIFTVRWYAACGIVTASRRSVRPSVSLSVRDIEVLWSHRLEYFENNFTVSYSGVLALCWPQQHGSTPKGTLQNFGQNKGVVWKKWLLVCKSS